MLTLLAQATTDFSTETTGTVDTATATGVGIFVLVIYLAMLVALAFFYVFTFGNILQAALGKSKWMALLLFVPIVNFILMIIWGLEASKKNKEMGAGTPTQDSDTDTAAK